MVEQHDVEPLENTFDFEVLSQKFLKAEVAAEHVAAMAPAARAGPMVKTAEVAELASAIALVMLDFLKSRLEAGPPWGAMVVR